MPDIQGKTVLITGASRGIGESAAHVFAKAGANVVLVARGARDIERIAGEIGDKALAVTCDVSDYASVAAAVQQAVDHFGGLDVLINNAGVIEPISHLDASDPEGWGKVIDINLKGVYHGMRAAMPVMEANGTFIPLKVHKECCDGKNIISMKSSTVSNNSNLFHDLLI